MKLNWGVGISIALTLFIGFIVFLAVILMSKNVDLESEDYYKREVNYQDEIKQLQQADKHNNPLILIDQEDFLILQIPDSLNISNVEIKLIRPDDEKKDKYYRVVGTKSFLISKVELTKGVYTVEIRYLLDKQKCFQKNQIRL